MPLLAFSCYVIILPSTSTSLYLLLFLTGDQSSIWVLPPWPAIMVLFLLIQREIWARSSQPVSLAAEGRTVCIWLPSALSILDLAALWRDISSLKLFGSVEWAADRFMICWCFHSIHVKQIDLEAQRLAKQKAHIYW